MLAFGRVLGLGILPRKTSLVQLASHYNFCSRWSWWPSAEIQSDATTRRSQSWDDIRV